VSPSNATDDTVKKLRLYHRVGIPHYWLADPRDATLTVMRWSPDGYITVLRAERHEVVRAEPFDAITIAVGPLFGDEPPPEVTLTGGSRRARAAWPTEPSGRAWLRLFQPPA
jgi:hypothetical protein